MSHLTASHLSDLHKGSKDEAVKLGPTHYQYGKKDQNALNKYPRAASASKEPQIPDPKIFNGLAASADDLERLPAVAECAVHLELLEAFFALRSKILKSAELDTTFGVKPENKVVYRKTWDLIQRKYVPKEHKLQDKTFQTRRREKWPYYLTLAVGRFRMWMRRTDMAMAANGAGSGSSKSVAETNSSELPHLPPLGKSLWPEQYREWNLTLTAAADVLMVWHAFLLNPLDYRKCA